MEVGGGFPDEGPGFTDGGEGASGGVEGGDDGFRERGAAPSSRIGGEEVIRQRQGP